MLKAHEHLCGKQYGVKNLEHEHGRKGDEKDGRPRYGMLKARDQTVDFAHAKASGLITQPPQPIRSVSGPPSPACRLHSCCRHRPSCSVCLA